MDSRISWFVLAVIAIFLAGLCSKFGAEASPGNETDMGVSRNSFIKDGPLDMAGKDTNDAVLFHRSEDETSHGERILRRQKRSKGHIRKICCRMCRVRCEWYISRKNRVRCVYCHRRICQYDIFSSRNRC